MLQRPLITLTTETPMLVGADGVIVSIKALDVDEDLAIQQKVDVLYEDKLYPGTVTNITPEGSIFIEIKWPAYLGLGTPE